MSIDKHYADALLAKILPEIKRTNSPKYYMEALAVLQEQYDEETLSWIRQKAVKSMKNNGREAYYDAYKLSLLLSAPHVFDCFLQYLEIDRKPEERFYLPRRKQLLPVVEALQDLETGNLEELFLSMPPRVGKSTLMLMFVCWRMGRDTEHPILYSSYSDLITKAFYNGVLEILTDTDTYNYGRIFPEVEIVRTNAQDEIMDLNRKKHYPTLTCRSLYGTLNGACDAEKGYIISDDLIGGIEEALNKDRLMSAWYKVDNNLIPRGKAGTKYLWIGTRWSVIDPAGVRMELLTNDERFKDYKWKAINVPALNENDESNFHYKYNVGFSTDYYKRRRASFERRGDTPSWLAQYQGVPVEREGTVFSPDELRYFDGTLPEEEPDRVFMAADVAWGGGDYTAAPVIYQYGDDLFVVDVVYSNADKRVTQPLVVNLIDKWGVGTCYIEATKTTASYAEDVTKLLKERGVRCNVQTTTQHWTGEGKINRIYERSPEIRENMIFVASGKRSKEYEMFMQNVFAFKLVGRVPHDDSVDSLAMAMTFAYRRKSTVKVLRRPF